MSEDDVREMIRTWIDGRDYMAAGAEIGVSAPWLCQIMKGRRRPSGKVLDAIGIARLPHGPLAKGLAFTKLEAQ